MKSNLTLATGRFKFSFKIAVRAGFGLGFDFMLASWHDAYPWFVFMLVLGPFLFTVDITNPITDTGY